MSLVKFKHSPNWYSRFEINGTKFQKTTGTTNKKLATEIDKKWYEEALAQKHQLGNKKISIADALNGYMAAHPNDGNIKKLANFFINWIPENKLSKLDDPIDVINSAFLENVVKLRREEGKKEGTILQYTGFLTRLVKWAKKNGYMTNPLEAPVIKVNNGRLRYLSQEEEQKLLEELNPEKDLVNLEDNLIKEFRQDNYDLCVILLDTGARLSEITTLQWKDINFKEKTISIYRPKVNNESILHMTTRTYHILQRRFSVRNSDFIFTNRRGEHKTAAGGISRAMRKVGLSDCTIHTLRHTTASRLIQSGMQLYEVSEILGHTNIHMTKRYAHLSKSAVTKKARDMLENKNLSAYNNPEVYKNPESYTNSYTINTPTDTTDMLKNLKLNNVQGLSIKTK